MEKSHFTIKSVEPYMVGQKPIQSLRDDPFMSAESDIQ